MSVTLILTGFLLPALAKIQAQARQVVCGSNLRQLGIACVAYTDEWGGMPYSYYGERGRSKSEMMVLHITKDGDDSWEGLGNLWGWRYLSSPEVFYCPSHRGTHPYEQYKDYFLHPRQRRVYGNYHYAGDKNWQVTPAVPRRFDEQPGFVIATDGLRTPRDINHRNGLNVLRSDVSVQWREDLVEQVFSIVSASGQQSDDSEDQRYSEIWDILNDAF